MSKFLIVYTRWIPVDTVSTSSDRHLRMIARYGTIIEIPLLDAAQSRLVASTSSQFQSTDPMADRKHLMPDLNTTPARMMGPLSIGLTNI